MDNPHSSEIDLNKKEKFALSKRYNTICILRENLKILLSQNIIPQPFIDLKMLANEGSAKAQFEVGLCYLRGFQVEQSDTSTFEYYLLAAKQGFLQAYFPLAYCYQYGIGIPISLSNALIYYEKRSNQKDLACQYFLGKMYQEGNVVEKSLNQAIYYYQRAAKEGYLPAILHLAQAYYEGSDLIQLQKKEHTFYEVSDYNGDPNLDNALKYYKKAADANFIPAMKITAHLYEILFPNSLDKAFYYYRKFADINFNQGWFDVFRCLLNGIGVGKSEEQALRYLKMALEQNLENSSYALGLYYLQIGKIEEAYESIQQAADKGDPKAQYHIGTCYDNGQIEQESYYAPINSIQPIILPYFIKPSIELAVKYYKLAANQNYAPAQEKIGDCYLYGIEVEKSIDQAFLYYKKAADQHYAPSQCKAGLILEQIKGDSKQAFKYYNFARLQKNLKGMCLYGLCKEKGIGTKINRSIAHRYFKDAADLGYPEGIFHLARSLEYEFELGIRLSGKKALYYYKRALQLGYDKLDDEREFIEEHIQIILKRMEDELYDIRNILIKEDVLLSESEKLNLSTNYGKKTNLEKVLELKEIFQENQQNASYLILSTISKEEAEVICDAMIDNKKFTLITACGHKKIHLAFEKAGYDSNTCFKNHFLRIYGSGHIAYLLKEDQEPCFENEEMASDAFLVLKERADEGSVEDQFLVGTCYQKGNGVQQSDKKAVYYYNLAAGKKHQKALVELGKSFEYGIGVKQSLSNSIKCYRALNEGVEKWKLLAHIHSHYPEEKSYSFTKAYYKELFNYYQFKAEEDAESQAILGNYFEIGLGIDKNLEQAIKYYKLSVQQNHPMGLCYLGECYEFGNGVDRSVEQAISYYKLASNQNSLRALYCLAKCLFNNNQEHLAIEYFKQLANNPSDFQGQAQYLLGVCYEKGIGCEKSEKIALEYYQIAAHTQTAIAQDRLGDAYRKGELGIQIDPYIAFDYYRKATELNCMFSAEKLLHYYRIHQRYSLPKQEKHINFIFSNFYEVFGKYQQGADEFNVIFNEENLELLYEAASQQKENAVIFYQIAAENGSEKAQAALENFCKNESNKI